VSREYQQRGVELSLLFDRLLQAGQLLPSLPVFLRQLLGLRVHQRVESRFERLVVGDSEASEERLDVLEETAAVVWPVASGELGVAVREAVCVGGVAAGVEVAGGAFGSVEVEVRAGVPQQRSGSAALSGGVEDGICGRTLSVCGEAGPREELAVGLVDARGFSGGRSEDAPLLQVQRCVRRALVSRAASLAGPLAHACGLLEGVRCGEGAGLQPRVEGLAGGCGDLRVSEESEVAGGLDGPGVRGEPVCRRPRGLRAEDHEGGSAGRCRLAGIAHNR